MMSQHNTSRHLLLHVWCGFLTIAMVIMAAVLISVKVSSSDKVAESKEENHHPENGSYLAQKDSPKKSHLSYIQLTMRKDPVFWENDNDVPKCGSCSLVLRNNSVFITSAGFYYIFAQVTFTKPIGKESKRTVTLIRNGTNMQPRKLSEAVIYGDKEGTVFISKIFKLQPGNSVSLQIASKNNSFRYGGENTYWGAYQLPLD
ncbi:uncharacterized protein LOC105031347 [Esox lucius]|uniref:THD domain-containing protein n=1 Tax=Esox lucius TaxID=8010 RepID=A0A3P9A6L8_ESOLU|nr:uncharacterized protein LOC105031347 [Esox lucius]XP_010904004.1 uncharacterized protein LOC105031347 [Esox lucius]XP_010904005.1 uncharacterized protein LOC105031347 [Esox lucius]